MRKKYGISGRIAMAALVAVSLFSMVGSAIALSNSGGGSWQYYKEITVSENSGSTLTAYQALVQLSSSNFPTSARSDGADIRFTDASNNELSYWIESWDYAGRSAKIWVKAPSIPASAATTIRMYYGNPSASSSSSGDATFLLFDDMNDNSLDTNKWQAVGKPILEQNGEWETGYSSTYEPFGNIISKSTFSGNIGISVKIQTTGDGHTFPNVPVMRSSTSDWGWTGYRLYFSKYDNSIAFARIDASTMTNLFNFNPSLYSINTFYTFKVNFFGSSINGGLYDINGNAIETFNLVDNTYRTGYVSVRGPAYSSSVAKWDDIKIHKYASPEPTLSLGTEQLVPTPTPTTPTPITPTPTTPAPTTPAPTTPTPTTTTPAPTTPAPTTPATTTPAPTTPAPTAPPAPKQPLLTISQTTLKEEPEVGEEVLITVTLQNSGEGTAKNIRLTEQIPSSIAVSFVDGADKPGNLVTWNGELAPNRAHAIVHTLKIVEKKSRAIPMTIRYEDEVGNPRETSTTIYVTAQEVPATPVQTKAPESTSVSTPRVTIPGFTGLLVLIGLVAAILLVRRR